MTLFFTHPSLQHLDITHHSMKRKRSESPLNTDLETQISSEAESYESQNSSFNLAPKLEDTKDSHSAKRSRTRLDKTVHLHIPQDVILYSRRVNDINYMGKPLYDAISGSMDEFPVLLVFKSKYSFYDIDRLQELLAKELSHCPVVRVKHNQQRDEHQKEDQKEDQKENQKENQKEDLLTKKMEIDGETCPSPGSPLMASHVVYDTKAHLAKECRVLDPVGGGSEPVDSIVIVDSLCRKIGTVVLGPEFQPSVLKQLKYYL